MCTCTCRLVLFVVNIIVGMAGFLLLLFGSMLTWGKVVVQEQLLEHIGPLIKNLYGAETAVKFSHLAELVLRFTAPFGLIIFSFGAAILILCVFGCCGACTNKKSCLKIYLSLLILITVMEFAIVAFYYSNRTAVLFWTRRLLEKCLVKYKSLESDDPYSVLFNVMMSSMNCCGIQNGTDFDEAKDFVRVFNTTAGIIELAYPIPCCKMSREFVILDQTCPATFDDSNSNIGKGCWTELFPHLKSYGNVVAIVGIVVMLFHAILIVMVSVVLAMERDWLARN